MAALARQADRELARERVDGAPQGGHLVATGVHEIDVLRQRLAQRARHRLGAPVGHQAAADLRLDLLAQALDALLELVALQTLLERRELAGFLASGVHQTLEHGVELEVPQRPVEVVGATHGSPRLHPGEARDGAAGDGAHHRLVAPHQRLEEHLGQLLRRERLHRPAGTRLGRALGPLAVGRDLPVTVAVRVERALAGAQREVDLEHRLERPPVGVALHERGAERVLEGLAVLERDVLHRLHRVEVLGERYRQARGPQLLDEPREHVEHVGPR